MLLELRISNLAIIERSEIHCGPGLNVLTGETGAGKSVLVQALGLLVGERAAAEQVGQREGASGAPARALVEGAFSLAGAPRAAAYLEEQEIPLDDQLIITREVAADGRSRVRLNGRLATAATLREIGTLLIDLHGQHEHQLLLRADTHLGFLDAYGDAAHAALRAATRHHHQAWRETQTRLDELTSNEQQRAQRLDMLRFQADEIDAAAPQPDEETQLTDERARLTHAERLRTTAGLCRDALSGGDEPGALGLLQQALKTAREIESYDGSVTAWVEQLQSAFYTLDDAATEARRYAEALEADPLRQEEVEARLHHLNRLKRKYGDSLARVIGYRSQIEAELSRLSVSESELGALREAAERQRAGFRHAAEQLSQSRHRLARQFAADVCAHLRSLAMERARFEVRFERDDSGSREGIDRVEFLLSANPGQPPRPLARIASGGEISRVMLALRSVLSTATAGPATRGPKSADGSPGSNSSPTSNGARPAGAAPVGPAGAVVPDDPSAPGKVPILIFDEIDVGIGGVTAEAVGEKMQELARSFQVLCVTHLPQIARRADRHYRVAKETGEARTRVTVTLLEGEERVRELARMMGRESEANLRHARELLEL